MFDLGSKIRLFYSTRNNRKLTFFIPMKFFREFYYIQMEKFARDAVADDRIQCKEDIVVSR